MELSKVSPKTEQKATFSKSQITKLINANEQLHIIHEKCSIDQPAKPEVNGNIALSNMPKTSLLFLFQNYLSPLKPEQIMSIVVLWLGQLEELDEEIWKRLESNWGEVMAFMENEKLIPEDKLLRGIGKLVIEVIKIKKQVA